MNSPHALPTGQRAIPQFPRFGLSQFADRFPTQPASASLRIIGEVAHEIEIERALDGLPRVDQFSDFHCVTTWSHLSLNWSGVRFRDFYERVIVPTAAPRNGAGFVVLRAQDGYRSCLLLEDLLGADVLLADTLNGQPLSIEHGAPLRLIAPAHYGYKSVKHLSRIEFCLDDSGYRPAAFRFMEHPRARVAFEERGRWVAGWLLRFLYRPLIGVTISRFDRAMRAYRAADD